MSQVGKIEDSKVQRESSLTSPMTTKEQEKALHDSFEKLQSILGEVVEGQEVVGQEQQIENSKKSKRKEVSLSKEGPSIEQLQAMMPELAELAASDPQAAQEKLAQIAPYVREYLNPEADANDAGKIVIGLSTILIAYNKARPNDLFGATELMSPIIQPDSEKFIRGFGSELAMVQEEMLEREALGIAPIVRSNVQAVQGSFEKRALDDYINEILDEIARQPNTRQCKDKVRDNVRRLLEDLFKELYQKIDSREAENKFKILLKEIGSEATWIEFARENPSVKRGWEDADAFSREYYDFLKKEKVLQKFFDLTIEELQDKIGMYHTAFDTGNFGFGDFFRYGKMPGLTIARMLGVMKGIFEELFNPRGRKDYIKDILEEIENSTKLRTCVNPNTILAQLMAQIQLVQTQMANNESEQAMDYERIGKEMVDALRILQAQLKIYMENLTKQEENKRSAENSKYATGMSITLGSSALLFLISPGLGIVSLIIGTLLTSPATEKAMNALAKEISSGLKDQYVEAFRNQGYSAQEAEQLAEMASLAAGNLCAKTILVATVATVSAFSGPTGGSGATSSARSVVAMNAIVQSINAFVSTNMLSDLITVIDPKFAKDNQELMIILSAILQGLCIAISIGVGCKIESLAKKELAAAGKASDYLEGFAELPFNQAGVKNPFQRFFDRLGESTRKAFQSITKMNDEKFRKFMNNLPNYGRMLEAGALGAEAGVEGYKAWLLFDMAQYTEKMGDAESLEAVINLLLSSNQERFKRYSENTEQAQNAIGNMLYSLFSNSGASWKKASNIMS